MLDGVVEGVFAEKDRPRPAPNVPAPADDDDPMEDGNPVSVADDDSTEMVRLGRGYPEALQISSYSVNECL